MTYRLAIYFGNVNYWVSISRARRLAGRVQIDTEPNTQFKLSNGEKRIPINQVICSNHWIKHVHVIDPRIP